jgi:hypothetical protein
MLDPNYRRGYLLVAYSETGNKLASINIKTLLNLDNLKMVLRSFIDDELTFYIYNEITGDRIDDDATTCKGFKPKQTSGDRKCSVCGNKIEVETPMCTRKDGIVDKLFCSGVCLENINHLMM